MSNEDVVMIDEEHHFTREQIENFPAFMGAVVGQDHPMQGPLDSILKMMQDMEAARPNIWIQSSNIFDDSKDPLHFTDQATIFCHTSQVGAVKRHLRATQPNTIIHEGAKPFSISMNDIPMPKTFSDFSPVRLSDTYSAKLPPLSGIFEEMHKQAMLKMEIEVTQNRGAQVLYKFTREYVPAMIEAGLADLVLNCGKVYGDNTSTPHQALEAMKELYQAGLHLALYAAPKKFIGDPCVEREQFRAFMDSIPVQAALAYSRA